jgi:hypothetical protein
MHALPEKLETSNGSLFSIPPRTGVTVSEDNNIYVEAQVPGILGWIFNYIMLKKRRGKG